MIFASGDGGGAPNSEHKKNRRRPQRDAAEDDDDFSCVQNLRWWNEQVCISPLRNVGGPRCVA